MGRSDVVTQHSEARPKAAQFWATMDHLARDDSDLTVCADATDSIVGVRVAWGEATLAREVKAAGGVWNRPRQVWELRYDQVVALGLVDRMILPTLYYVQERWLAYWMLTSNTTNLHPVVVTRCSV